MNKPTDEFLRRRVICYLDSEFLISILEGRFELCGWPEDAIVLSVHSNWERDAVGVMVASSQFALVPDGELSPEVGCFWKRSMKVHDLGEGQRPRHMLTSVEAERIETPDGKVKFREFI